MGLGKKFKKAWSKTMGNGIGSIVALGKGGAIDEGMKKGFEVGKGLWNDFTGKSAVDLQNKYNMEMWNLQNEYNTPANQVKRMLEAGLNPNLFYSQGDAGNAKSAPEMTAYQGSAKKLFDLANWFLGVKGQLDASNLEKVKTLAGIQQSQDALQFEKQKWLVESAFRERTLANADRDYNLRKERWDFERGHIQKYGTKPGTTIDFLNSLIGSTLGKSTVDVGTDLNKILNTSFSQLFMPVTWANNVNSWLNSQASKFVRGLGKDMSKIRY